MISAAVDGQRHGASEARVGEDPAQAFLRMGDVELEDDVGTVAARPDVGRVPVLLLVALEQRDVGRHQLAPGDRHLAGRCLGRHDLLAVDLLHLEEVDVGKLVALGIDLEVVGVAPVAGAGRGLADDGEGRKDGAVEDLEVVDVVDHLEVLAPVLQPLLHRLALELRRVGEGRVVALQEVRRRQQAFAAVGHVLEQQGPRRREVVAEPVGAVDLDPRPLEHGQHHGSQVGVQLYVLEVEGEVGRGQRMPVRPPDPLAQGDGHGAPAVAEPGALGEVRQVAAQLRPDPERPLGRVEDPGARVEYRGRSPVAADAAERLGDDRVPGEPLLHRGQLPGGHLGVEQRGLPEAFDTDLRCRPRRLEPAPRPGIPGDSPGRRPGRTVSGFSPCRLRQAQGKCCNRSL